ncbi:MAG: hypothetical protein U0P45_00140 [Acidimicrobiales bacterium]
MQDVADAPPATSDQPGDGPATPAGKRPPMSTRNRRIVSAVILIAVLAIAFVGTRGLGTSGGDNLDQAIVALFPNDGAQALRQTEVGVDLKPGYDGRLVINGVAIPESQMIGARDPKTTDPRDIEENGIRPNNKNHVFFKPGPGKVFEELPQGTVFITARFWQDGRKSETSRVVSWTIRVD